MNTWRSATGRAVTRRCCWSACHSGGSAADGGGKQRQQYSGGDGGSLGGSFGGRKQETRCRPAAVRESRVSKPTAALTDPTLGSVRPALLMPADVGGEQMACSWSPDVHTAAAAHMGLVHHRRCADHACCALFKSIARCRARASGLRLSALQVLCGAAAACQRRTAAAAAAATAHTAAETHVISRQAAAAELQWRNDADSPRCTLS